MADSYLRCGRCRRTVLINTAFVVRLRASTGSSWKEPLDAVFSRGQFRLKCSRCGARAAKLLTEIDPGLQTAISSPGVEDEAERKANISPEYEDWLGIYDEERLYGPSEFAYYDDDSDRWVEPGEEEDDDSFADVDDDDRDDWS
jgi:hypothetical protein